MALPNPTETLQPNMLTGSATALDSVPVEPQEIKTPTGAVYQGVRRVKRVCGVSILRAGASLEDALRIAYEYVGMSKFLLIFVQRHANAMLTPFSQLAAAP